MYLPIHISIIMKLFGGIESISFIVVLLYLIRAYHAVLPINFKLYGKKETRTQDFNKIFKLS